MIGSTFVHAPVPAELVAVADDVDALDDFDRVDMDSMLTLDFVTVCGGHDVSWASPQPVVFDKDAGIAIFGVEPEALAWVISNFGLFAAEQQADLERLRAFVSEHGLNSIFEVSTF